MCPPLIMIGRASLITALPRHRNKKRIINGAPNTTYELFKTIHRAAEACVDADKTKHQCTPHEKTSSNPTSPSSWTCCRRTSARNPPRGRKPSLHHHYSEDEKDLKHGARKRRRTQNGNARPVMPRGRILGKPSHTT